MSDEWSAVPDWLSRYVDLEASARTCGAFERAREIKSAADLLRLILAYAVGGLSLRGTCAWAEAAGVAALADPSLLERLCKARPWLEHLLGHVLAGRAPLPAALAGRRLRLVDATTVCRPGADRTTWRVHAAYDPAAGRIEQIALSDIHGGESLTRFAVAPGDLVVLDAYYARVKDLRHGLAAPADLLVRMGWNALRLHTPEGEPFDLFAALRRLAGDWGEAAVVVTDEEGPMPLRLILGRKSEAQAEKARRRVRQQAKKRGKTPDARSLEAAGYVLLLTSLPDTVSARDVLALYRVRWQVELAFKRWKSLLDFGQLPAKDPNLAQTWLYGKLLAALMIEDQAQSLLDSPPCAPDIQTDPLAVEPHRAARPHPARPHPRPRPVAAARPSRSRRPPPGRAAAQTTQAN